MATSRHTLIVIGSFAVAAVIVSFLTHHPQDKVVPDTATYVGSGCASSNEKETCLVEAYETYAKNNGTNAALRAVHQAIVADPSFGGTCHNIMHHIGHVALIEFGSFKAAYDEGNYDCGNGYFHGVVEQVFRAEGADAFGASRLESFCDTVQSTSTTTKDYALLNCVHGLGHVLVYKNKGELVSALPSCMYLKRDSERTECVAGAFMENMIERLPLVAQSDPTKNPSLTCSSVSGDLYRCWAALAGFVLSSNGKGVNAAVNFCNGFDLPMYREACGIGIGKAVSFERGIDTEAKLAYCNAKTQALASFCVKGATSVGASEDSPFYSQAFGMLLWPSASGTDPLIGSIKKLE